MEGRTYFKKGDPAASMPAPARARSAADTDEQGWPKALIKEELDVPEELLLEQERKRQLVLEQHRQAEAVKPAAPQFIGKPVPLESHMTQQEFDELGYPKVPEEWTEEYIAKRLEEEKVDPRVNPNLLLDENHQEFWFNASRKPFAKAVLRSEKHWTERRNVWLKQYEHVERANQSREVAAELLEDCSMEVKRLVAPVLHHRITEVLLWNYMREADAYNIPFSQLIEDPSKLRELRGLRQKIDAGGDEAARRMIEDYDEKAMNCMAANKKKQDDAKRGERIVSDTDNMAKRLNMGQKFKKDGYLEWHQGNVDEALAAWRMADAHLKMYKLPDEDEAGNQMIAEQHSAVLKNIAQAAIKLGYWTEALEAADDALRIDDHDHKAWFRRACALEGLGRYEEEEQALDRIDDLVVGRPDCERVQKDTGSKRGKLQLLYERDKNTQKRGLARAVARGVFSGDREAAPRPLPGDPATASSAARRSEKQPLLDEHGNVVGVLLEDGDFTDSDEAEDPPAPGAAAPGPAAVTEALPERRRPRLTKDSAAELLEALRRAYGDSMFQKQVAKLVIDVRRDKQQFLTHLKKVALEAQRPVLEKWGFEPSSQGMEDMQLAIRDHTSGESADVVLKEKEAAVAKLLHGDMYETVFVEYLVRDSAQSRLAGKLKEEVVYTEGGT